MRANATWNRAAFGAALIALAAVTRAPAQQPPVPKTKVAPKAVVPEGAKVGRDIEYARPGGTPLRLDLYLPDGATGKLPVIVWVHGGGWQAGSKEQAGPALRQIRRGYAVASVGYRLSGVATYPAQIEDCKAAVRWLRANAAAHNLDPDHIGAWGSSAGGHLVALLGTTGGVTEFDKGDNLSVSSRVQAVCDWFGPTDLLQMDAHAPADARIKHDGPFSPEAQLIGGPIQSNKEKVARANPITYVTKDAAPFLILHGDKDPVVPHHQSELLRDALTKAGVEVHLRTVEGNGHGGPGFSTPDAARMVDAFFDQHLKGGAAPDQQRPAQQRPAARPAPNPGAELEGMDYKVKRVGG